MSTDRTNPALELILADYQRYHVALVIVAGVLLAGLVVVIVACVRSLRAARRSSTGASRRERWTYRAFIVAAAFLGLFLLVVIAANISTAVDPQRGFAGVDQSGDAMTAWLASASPTIPTDVQERIDARLAWQRPKAIIVSVLLVLMVVVSVAVWRRWVHHSSPSRGANVMLLAGGLVSALLVVLLGLMVMGNTQASIAPIALTLVYG